MRKATLAALAAAASLGLAACSTGSAADDVVSETTGANAGEFPVTVTHNAGETTIESQPESIVVLDMAALDTIDALGAGELVTGVPVSSVPTWLADEDGIDYSTLTSVGSLKEPDLEEIAKLNPDLVIVGARSASFYDELSGAFPTIDASVPWDQGQYSKLISDSVRMLGEAVGHGEEGADLANRIDEEVEAFTGAASDKGTAMVLMTSGGEVSMHGTKSRWAPIWDVFGFEPVTSEEEAEEGHVGDKISFETVRELNPDYIFVVDRDAAIGQTDAGATAEQVLDNNLVRETNAAKADNIIYLSPERWYIVMTGASNYLAELNEIGNALK